MKKILTTALAMIAGMAIVQAQGLVKIFNISSTFSTFTNTGFSAFQGGTQLGGVSGKTAASSSGSTYYYQLLLAPMSSIVTSSSLSGWYAPAGLGLATNSIMVGSIGGPGGNSGTPVATWANGGASATSDTQGTELQYMLVGWSASIGNSWSTVANEMTSGVFSADGFLGTSSVGFGYSGGGGTPAGPGSSIFGVSASMPGGLASGFNLYFVTVPEPGTLALMALGSASLLLFRRKK